MAERKNLSPWGNWLNATKNFEVPIRFLRQNYFTIFSSPVTAVKLELSHLQKNAQNVQPFILEVNWGALRLHYERLHVLTSWGGEMGGTANCLKCLKLFEKSWWRHFLALKTILDDTTKTPDPLDSFIHSSKTSHQFLRTYFVRYDTYE